MKRDLLYRGLTALSLCALLANTASAAEKYFVRNRPFAQVVTVGGEPMVDTEAFLRALGYNWTVEGNVVTLTTQPASNTGIPRGPVTFRNGAQQLDLEASQRGSSTFVSLRPLAKFLDFSVTENRSSGTVDVTKARFATDEEKKLTEQLAAQREQEKQQADEAWAKKVAERRAKKDADAKKGEGENKESGKSENGEKPEKGDEGKAAPPPAETGNTNPTEPAKEVAKEAPKQARLEVFRSEAIPDPSNGVVTLTAEIKNTGDAPSKPLSGRVVLKGPSANGNVTENAGGTQSVWFQKSVSGPVLMPGTSWVYTDKYRHPSGNSMPQGNITLDFTLNNTK